MSSMTRLGALAVGAALVGAACSPSGASEPERIQPDGERVEILAPAHGSESDGTVEFIVDKGQVDTTGDTVGNDADGDFWLVVDHGCANVGDALPVDDAGYHRVPAGADSIELDLGVGAHNVCFQFADSSNVAYYEVDEITIRVTT
jgi:hypothetical protein